MNILPFTILATDLNPKPNPISHSKFRLSMVFPEWSTTSYSNQPGVELFMISHTLCRFMCTIHYRIFYFSINVILSLNLYYRY